MPYLWFIKTISDKNSHVLLWDCCLCISYVFQSGYSEKCIYTVGQTNLLQLSTLCKTICPLLYLGQVRWVDKVTSCKWVQGRDRCCSQGLSDPNLQERLRGPASPSCMSSPEMATGVVEAVEAARSHSCHSRNRRTRQPRNLDTVWPCCTD